MSSLTGRIRDDYDVYVEMCDILNIEPKEIRYQGNWYEEMRGFIQEAGVENEQQWFSLMKEKKIYKPK